MPDPLSLADFVAQESTASAPLGVSAAEPVSPAPAEPQGEEERSHRDSSAGSPPEPVPGQEPEAAEAPSGSEAPPPQESETDDDEAELASYPKPPFDPQALAPEQKTVHDYWRRVMRVKAQELAARRAEIEKTYEGLDPALAREAVRYVELLADNKYRPVIEALVDPEHPHHRTVVDRLSQSGAPSPAPTQAAPQVDAMDLIRRSLADDGETIDPEKLRVAVEALAASRAELLAQTRKGAPTQAPRQPVDGKRVWNVFARENGLPESEYVEYGRVYHELYGDGPPPAHLAEDPFKLLETLKRNREAEVRSKVERGAERRRGSVPPPAHRASAAPVTPLKPKQEMTLAEYEAAERAGRL